MQMISLRAPGPPSHSARNLGRLLVNIVHATMGYVTFFLEIAALEQHELVSYESGAMGTSRRFLFLIQLSLKKYFPSASYSITPTLYYCVPFLLFSCFILEHCSQRVCDDEYQFSTSRVLTSLQ